MTAIGLLGHHAAAQYVGHHRLLWSIAIFNPPWPIALVAAFDQAQSRAVGAKQLPLRGRLRWSEICPVAGLNRKLPAKAETGARDPLQASRD
jgi:hypothetical protein